MKKQKPMERGAGVLLPVTSLPSPYGIGTFGQAAYDFVDFLVEAGQRWWQVLPLGPTSYGDSPYQSFSAFAGNPYFIDLDCLLEQGLLTQIELEESDCGRNPMDVDYASLYEKRFAVLRQAFARSKHQDTADYLLFCEENAEWLEEYALYMSLKNEFGGREWLAWTEEFRLREPKALCAFRERNAEEIEFWKFCQFEFFRQWYRLKEYANQKGIEIIGDIPIYVALDSADVWSQSEQFQLDEQRRPTLVAGVPPDLFSETGQLWGNPLYDWAFMEREGYTWWKRRMRFSARLYDVIRIDHFVGIAHYYSIPAEETTALSGWWNPGPGLPLIEAIAEVMGNKRVIAENLGVVIPEVDRLLNISGYPGMKLMQFAFDSDETNSNLPFHFERNLVVYGGTHDNETLAGFFAHQKQKTMRFARAYLNVKNNRKVPAALIHAGYSSVANTVIFQMQDLLGLGNSARTNTPSTIGQNWRWRLTPGQIPPRLAENLHQMMKLYGRLSGNK
ncbi:MAG: 4-alpha-glucanotransferase [Clostridium sp.]|uniref:4-alpha-glucanotransferase n=1 Tax=Clostridium sp. TaxID=1506 RepID=UPI00290F9839|nr:4-alpha-glucanotransferase [Clostridium sp.]MDU7337343.1 4-alpha-glucanotransferase [Clostridium sp.]